MNWNNEATTALHEERLEAVVDAVYASGARTLLDLGCGDGDVLVRLAREPRLERILALDLDARCLEQVRLRLNAAEVREPRRPRNGKPQPYPRIELRHGSLTEPDDSLSGFDCAILVETIEHIDPRDLSRVEQAIFARMRPQTVIITTPNAEFNPLLEVPSNRFRHPDHRFEWDRARFQHWARGIAQRHGYSMTHRDIGGLHPLYGGASQMALLYLHNSSHTIQPSDSINATRSGAA